MWWLCALFAGGGGGRCERARPTPQAASPSALSESAGPSRLHSWTEGVPTSESGPLQLQPWGTRPFFGGHRTTNCCSAPIHRVGTITALNTPPQFDSCGRHRYNPDYCTCELWYVVETTCHQPWGCPVSTTVARSSWHQASTYYLPHTTRAGINTRTGGGSENHTVWRGAYNAPPSISAPMRASATNFGGYLGPY